VAFSDSVSAITETLALNPLNPRDLITTFGVVGIWAILFAETGLLVGFFLPGDSLLFLAGVAASGVGARLVGEPMNLPALLLGAPICAIAGAQLGHYLGSKVGRRLFEKPDSRFFRREYVEKAEHYFQKFGPAKAVILARFIPIVRTFLNPVAGVLAMPPRRFFLWNLIGGILWTDGVILAGYLLGDSIPAEAIDKYLIPVVLIIVVISLLPVGIEMVRSRRAGKTRETSSGSPRSRVM
jgi:membrane-associated protein